MSEHEQSVLPGAAMHDVPGLWMGEPLSILGLSLGHGVYFQPSTADWARGQCVGGIVWHTHPDGAICGGGVFFQHGPHASEQERARPLWQVTSFDPLTITPSVRASSGPGGGECLHGFITGGVWIPC